MIFKVSSTSSHSMVLWLLTMSVTELNRVTVASTLVLLTVVYIGQNSYCWFLLSPTEMLSIWLIAACHLLQMPFQSRFNSPLCQWRQDCSLHVASHHVVLSRKRKVLMLQGKSKSKRHIQPLPREATPNTNPSKLHLCYEEESPRSERFYSAFDYAECNDCC